MPRFTQFPVLFDECKTLNISDFKRWGYLNPNQIKSGHLTFSRNGDKTGSIGFAIDTEPPASYMELFYDCNDKPIKYTVQLVTIPSNLGKGVIWYFVCPRTLKRCRKLHLVDTYFLHRSAFRGCFYEKQIQSHNNRKLLRLFQIIFGTDKAAEKIYSKHFKKQYRGKPTKVYLKLMKQVEAYEKNSDDLLRFYRDSIMQA